MIESCFSKDELTVLKQAIETYGWESQTDMMIEEMSELTKALLKFRRAKKNQTKKALALVSIHEEMADVEIMLCQMQMVYGNRAAERRYKLERLAEDLKKERNNDERRSD